MQSGGKRGPAGLLRAISTVTIAKLLWRASIESTFPVRPNQERELPDSPAVEWSIQLISSLVLKQVKESSINLVLTFDVCGVSGHANHTAIYKALRYLGSSGRIPDGCCFLSLQSVSMIRKYLSILELPISWILASDYSTVAALKEYRRARAAMLRHRSQLLWFRHLYLLFSRYMLINTFQVIAAKEKDLKSQ
ncbi:N-acetylglucosaminyl-phosphatidylinositol de-N-acetylase isoform X2 [Paramormyrops kingsleyae]|uniref:N-acetylglucosaminyl-phosphatidylinositol de-N-acetylase isoform X2 n=1 Tax=Paramormyrops kingsleyae TaxID=1676925 RepID=UPI000CD61079|nr:N-acetylglucosaminyl-phosphatidylinositol de-N-acetylase isoform X3 [Paramormyrops kingsleyae]